MPHRLALLAALADPQRLRIVDALALGDRAPSELGRDLGLTSNLLAHHLGVLEDARVLRRRRSDGDGRRSYLTLNWEEPLVSAVVAHGPSLGACRVVFVCTANSARSQFAASLLARQCELPVASAGTQPAAQIHPQARDELNRRGLEPIATAPAPLETTVRDGDLVVAVCDNAYEDTNGRAQLHWSVPDPASPHSGHVDDPDPAAFTAAFDDIEPRVRRLAAALTTPTPAP